MIDEYPSYLRDVPPGQRTYGTLSYNRRARCWTIKGEPCVTELAKRNHISMPEEELLLEVNKWELSHGGMSGRTAQQFIDHLLGVEKE